MGARGTVAGERRRDARHGRRRGRGGYSLVEASITLAVVGSMGAIAVPSLRALLPRLRLANDTEVLMKEIGLARRQAIARSEAACIAFALRDQGADPAARDAYAFGRWVGGA